MRKITVVYDCDDVLNNLNKYVSNQVGIDPNSITCYNIRKNTHIPKDIQDQMMALYSNVNTFKNLELMPGADRIFDIKRLGARVIIHSASLNSDIANYKFISLLSNIPNIEATDLSLPVVDGKSKDTYSKADIVIEDCIEHLLKYPDNTIKILINKSYNQSEAYSINDETSGIIRVTDLNSAINAVESIIALLNSRN